MVFLALPSSDVVVSKAYIDVVTDRLDVLTCSHVSVIIVLCLMLSTL